MCFFGVVCVQMQRWCLWMKVCGRRTSANLADFLKIVQEVIFSSSMLPFAKAAHDKWMRELMKHETTAVCHNQGNVQQIGFNFNGLKPETTGELEHWLFDANGNITKMVKDRRLAEVGGILYKLAFYSGLEYSSKNSVRMGLNNGLKKWNGRFIFQMSVRTRNQEFDSMVWYAPFTGRQGEPSNQI